ncbi:MAG TPA: nucleotidyltransferase family protein [Cyclobacteriaceae bacterium]
MEKAAQGNIPILLLAAGSSSRMGQSKQLLSISGKTLIRRIAEVCLSSNTGKVVVVLGANENVHKKEIQDLPVEIISNPDWDKGMGTSIKAGVKFVASRLPTSAGVIISVCDQPHLTAKHLIGLTEQFASNKKLIIASTYAGVQGVPALFDAFYFNALLQLANEGGARKIIQKYSHAIVDFPFPEGAIDLDTMTDYNIFNDNA